MRLPRWISLSLVFVISIAAGYWLFRTAGSTFGADAPEIDWRALGDMDYVTGKSTPELKKLDGQTIKIPGFMVPLEDSQKSVTQFLLVPSPQACIHVQPPPPNQMILVDMKNSDTKVADGPIWVYGILHLTSKHHLYGESSFQMDGLRVEPYQ